MVLSATVVFGGHEGSSSSDIRLDNAAADLPPAVRRLQGTFVQPVRTTGDGACAIHSVWGNPLEGMLFKADARKFLGDAFGSNARFV